MRLTPFAKIFITLVILGVIGYAVWHYKGGDIRSWAGAEKKEAATEQVSADDFDALKNAPGDPGRDVGSTGVTSADARFERQARPPLVVGINTWAGHAPGIVYNDGMEPNAQSLYKQKHGLDVKFVLLEDPAAKLAAFRNGDVDIMWDTVDNWAREASILAEQNQKAKSIIMQDWSRGGDGIVSLSSIKSIEDLAGKRIACTQFTPSHFLLLYLLSQSGLSPEQRVGAGEEHRLHPGRAGGGGDVQGQAGRRGGDLGARPLLGAWRRAATRRTCWCRRRRPPTSSPTPWWRGRTSSTRRRAPCATSCTAGSTASR